jgi:hypothetical protein
LAARVTSDLRKVHGRRVITFPQNDAKALNASNRIIADWPIEPIVGGFVSGFCFGFCLGAFCRLFRPELPFCALAAAFSNLKQEASNTCEPYGSRWQART